MPFIEMEMADNGETHMRGKSLESEVTYWLRREWDVKKWTQQGVCRKVWLCREESPQMDQFLKKELACNKGGMFLFLG